ncbi:hypothetical protein N431DRAFT_350646 [Stipitochalara longipes BDJ]|nr:hypothetical protein N431DRAFT_350646 [Stipitochalara longipes BDJ]
MLGGAHPSISTPIHENPRKRLRKAPPRVNVIQNPHSCKEKFDILRSQSCLVVSEAAESSSLSNLEDNKTEEIPKIKRIGHLLEAPRADTSNDSIGICQADKMDHEHLRRRNAKTPVFAIGQLERKSATQRIDRAQTLAEQYQALLPPRASTPYLISLPKPAPKESKKLRKIKCQLSLRDMVKEQSNRAHSVAYSDAETLVGSEQPTSPPSPADAEFRNVVLPVIDPYEQISFHPTVCSDDIGLNICVDLLTNELATALFRQHPTEGQDRASGLQILLMIEAYKTIQKNVRQQLCDPQITQEMRDHVNSVDKLLRSWLKVLYSVYDQSQERNLQKDVVEGQWHCSNFPKGFHC